MEKKKKLGVALVGLGEYAIGELIPSLQETEHCYLAGLVSGDVEKLDHWGKEAGLESRALYSYDNFDQIVKNPDIDIVYITLPNSMHAEYCIRATRARKHIICEKPLAMDLDECRRIQEAVGDAGVRFSMGYRLHFDPYHMEAMRLGQQEVFGPVRKLVLRNSMEVDDDSAWRIDVERSGGGPLMNNGIYCIQAAIYITGKLPVAVEARFAPKTNPERFNEVPEGVEWTMFFEDGATAVCETSYVKKQSLMRAEAGDGWFELDPAYEYGDLKGKTSLGEMHFPPVKQQAKQMDDFAQCIRNGSDTRVPLEMGIRDMEIITATYESARSGERVELHLDAYAALPEY
nr:Gfo/Idh/MocA family oxidoreductase [uncultured Dyadobacter sp.]